MKAVARVPSCLRDCASFSPDMGFVQPGSYFEFGLRFRPNEQCLARCVRDGWGIGLPQQQDRSKVRDDDGQEHDAPSMRGVEQKGGILGKEGVGGGGVIAVPVRVDVPGQALPARLTLLSRVTGWKVEIDCDCGGGGGGSAGEHGGASSGGRSGKVHFGSCFVGQSVAKRVSLRNTSQLPAKFGFVSSPTEVGCAKATITFEAKLQRLQIYAKMTQSCIFRRPSSYEVRRNVGQGRATTRLK